MAKSSGSAGRGGGGGGGGIRREERALSEATGTAIQKLTSGEKKYNLYIPDGNVGVIKAYTRQDLVEVQKTLQREGINLGGGNAVAPTRQPGESKKAYDARRGKWNDLVIKTMAAIRDNHPNIGSKPRTPEQIQREKEREQRENLLRRVRLERAT